MPSSPAQDSLGNVLEPGCSDCNSPVPVGIAGQGLDLLGGAHGVISDGTHQKFAPCQVDEEQSERTDPERRARERWFAAAATETAGGISEGAVRGTVHEISALMREGQASAL